MLCKHVKMKNKLVVPKRDYKNEQKTIKYCSIELYTESASYSFEKVFGRIKNYCNLNQASYVSMLHDSDYYSEDTFDSNYHIIGRIGQKKANHVHCLVAFSKRVDLNGFANTIGIEERWIKILKHDYDFDNMIVYLTHIKYDPNVKHHYPPTLFDSNIFDYCNFIYDHAVAELEAKQSNIVYFSSDVLNLNKDKKVTYEMMLNCVTSQEYDVNEYNKYYRVIKDLIEEHNRSIQLNMDANKYQDMIQILQGQIGELQHNLDVQIETNMELRGISIDNKKGRWE